MMIRFKQLQRRLVLLLLIFLPCFSVLAVKVDNLNAVSITVPDRSSATMNAALKTAFAQVLVKMSGNPQVMTLPTIQNATPDLQQWVRSYRYISPETGDEDAQQPVNQLQLQVEFDQEGIAQLLQEAGQALLPADRPLTLICIDQDQEQWESLIKQQAQSDGLPVMFATMDLADQAVMQSPDMFTQLSQRYGVSSILVMHALSAQGDQTQFQVQYRLDGTAAEWQVSDAQKDGVVQAVFGHVMSEMVQKLSTANGELAQSKVTINIMGVQDVADYAKVTHYLRQLADVTDVTVKDMTGSGVIFEVNITGDLNRFKIILSNDGRLKPVSDALAQNAHNADLYYYW